MVHSTDPQGHPLPLNGHSGGSFSSPFGQKKSAANGETNSSALNAVKNGVNGYKRKAGAGEDTEEMDEWVESRLQQMTVEEKAHMLAGVDVWRTSAVPRLGIPQLKVHWYCSPKRR